MYRLYNKDRSLPSLEPLSSTCPSQCHHPGQTRPQRCMERPRPPQFAWVNWRLSGQESLLVWQGLRPWIEHLGAVWWQHSAAYLCLHKWLQQHGLCLRVDREREDIYYAWDGNRQRVNPVGGRSHFFVCEGELRPARVPASSLIHGGALGSVPLVWVASDYDTMNWVCHLYGSDQRIVLYRKG